MTCLLLVMTIASGTWAILYYTYTCSCTSADVIQGDKKSASRTNIEILSIDNRKESVKVVEENEAERRQTHWEQMKRWRMKKKGEAGVREEAKQ